MSFTGFELLLPLPPALPISQGQRIRKPMRNVGVVAARGSTLFTVTVLAPEESWGGERGEKFRQMAKSFRLTF